MLLNRALRGCVNSDFPDSDQNNPIQAHVRPAQEKTRELTLSVIYIQSNAGGGLHQAGRMMAGYLRHFLAVLSRSGSEEAPRLAGQPREASDFFCESAIFRADSLVFQIWTPIW